MKRIFMLSSHPLFSQGVETLLRREKDLEVVGRESDVDKAIDRIRELHPDIVILDHGSPTCSRAPIVMRILEEQLGSRVIGLDLQSNTVCVYRGEQIIVRGVEDLMKAVESDPIDSESVEIEK